jgi:hypothetical protein
MLIKDNNVLLLFVYILRIFITFDELFLSLF